MGAAPSRETHARGIYPLLSNTTGAGRKPDIVLIPLTKEFFPSPDCPLFVQFHQARCDAAVNYYFRRPGNPGDLSRIPNYAHSYDVDDGRADRRDRRQRLRELLHLHRSQHQLQHPDEPITSLHAADEAEDELLRHEFSSGTAEEVDEDRRSCATDDDEDDWERYVYVRASGVDVSFPSREALYRGVIEKVEEALFDTDAEMREAYNWARAHPNSTVGPDGKRQRKVLPVLCAVAFRYDPVKVAAAAAAPAGSGANPFQAAMDSGVPLGNALVNIVGCFGFVSMEEEVSAAQNSFQHSLSRSSLHSYSSHGGSNFADLKRSDLITLPPPVAAPLAAMVFLTKSAGEQNLGRVTHMAATTYYFQMIESGVIQRNQGEAHQPGHLPAAADSRLSPKTNDSASTTATTAAAAPTSAMEERPACSPPIPEFSLPPMETFSFSSLMTNIPILSFLYEMKWRWGYLGVLKASAAPTDDLPPRTAGSGGEQSQTVLEKTPSLSGARHRDSTMGNHSSGGLAVVDRTTGQHVTDEMEMWITPDSMLHGRISKDLAERLCWSLAERPEVMQERVTQLPSEETGYWRYRGLVNRFHPPPLPSPTETDLIHPKDVYVMGSAVLPGFDEGDILRFDAEHGVWFADHSIPLEGVVLAAMRPYCKLAREAPSDDPGWVAKMVLDEDVELEQYITTAADSRGEALGLNGEPLPLPTAREEQAKLQRANPHLQLVHEHVGNFFIYQFQRDGATYYHGTVPHFSNPKKRPALSTSFARGASSATTPVIPFEPALGKTNEVLLPSLAVSPDEVSSPRSPVASSGTSQSTPAPKPQVAIPSSIASALFSLLPTVGVSMSSGTHGSGTDDPPQPTYLANRVKSTTLGAARRWMKSLYAYAQGSSLRNATTTTTVATPVMSSPSSSPQGRGATTDLLNPKRGVPPHVPNAADHQTYDGANLTVHIHQRTSSPASSTSTAAVSPCPLPRSRQPSFQVSEVVPNAVVGKPYASFPTATTAIYPMPQTHGGSNPSSPVAFSRRLSHHGGFLVMEDRSGEVVMSSPAEVVQQSEPVKRVVEGGAGYVWDWRQNMNLVVAHRGSPST